MSSNAKLILYKEMRDPERRPAESSFQTGPSPTRTSLRFAAAGFPLCFWALPREFVFF